MPKFWLFQITGGTDPISQGEFSSFKSMALKARSLIRDRIVRSEYDTLLFVTIENGIPNLLSFAHSDLEE